MIKVKTLQKLLEHVPDDATVSAYEGEDIGISINFKDKSWWIRATPNDKEDTYIDGFSDAVGG